tara:strand:- start:54642 stop:55469 length:828 start_codon:yes stop_codon:yes gene_type:complete
MKTEVGKSVIINGIKTNYHDEGDGYPLILLHGSGPGVTAWANWRNNFDHFASKYRVIAPDMVGFGYTDAPDGVNLSPGLWVDHVVGLLDELGVDKAHVIGNSFGAGITLSMLLSHGDRFDKVVLMGAVGVDFEITEALDDIWGYKPSLDNMRKVVSFLSSGKLNIADELIKSRYEASLSESSMKSYRDNFGIENRQKLVDMFALPDADIKSIDHEVFVVHGKKDQVIPLSNSIKLCSLIKNSDLLVCSDAGHWVQIERKETFNTSVSNFLEHGFS